MGGINIEQLRVGMAVELAKTFDECCIDTFGALTGGLVHVDGACAGRTNSGGKTAHSLLTAGLVSTLLDTKLPGPGTVCLSQELQFLRPVRIGDAITARIEVIELARDQNLVRLRTVCTNQKGEMVFDGKVLVRPPRGRRVRMGGRGEVRLAS